MAVSFIVFEIKRDIGPKTPIFIPLPFNLHDHLKPLDFSPKFQQKLFEYGAKILPKSSIICFVETYWCVDFLKLERNSQSQDTVVG